MSEDKPAESKDDSHGMNVLADEIEEKVLGGRMEPRQGSGQTRRNHSTSNEERDIKPDRVFDPIGFAAVFIIREKIGMQQLWQ